MAGARRSFLIGLVVLIVVAGVAGVVVGHKAGWFGRPSDAAAQRREATDLGQELAGLRPGGWYRFTGRWRGMSGSECSLEVGRDPVIVTRPEHLPTIAVDTLVEVVARFDGKVQRQFVDFNPQPTPETFSFTHTELFVDLPAGK